MHQEALPKPEAEYFAHLSTLDPLMCFRMVKAMGEHSARDLLHEIEAPTLVLAGARDVMTPPRLAETMAACRFLDDEKSCSKKCFSPIRT